jgi:tetratricopeptide (TPR) repeat protein
LDHTLSPQFAAVEHHQQTSIGHMLGLWLVVALSGCGLLFDSTTAAHRAEELTQQERFEEAISQYRVHIQTRLKVSNRADWENPHFYLLRIGDLYLRMGQPQAALDAYREAEANQIEASLISDRYRAVAHWYVENNQLQSAFDVLKTYRDRDSLLFDAMLDRVGRALTKQENPTQGK